MNCRPQPLGELLPAVHADLARRHGHHPATTLTDRSTDMTDPDDEQLTVTLTRAEWRGVKGAIGDMWSGPQDVLWDRLDEMDLIGKPGAA